MNVLVLYTSPPPSVAQGRVTDEFDVSEAARSVASVLPRAVLAAVRGEPREILAALATHTPDVVYNLCEAPLGRAALEPHAAALFELAGVRFTGSGSETLALCRRKDRTSAVLAAAGVPVPNAGSCFPCFVKPADQDGSVGIVHESVCEDEDALKRARLRLDGPVIVEEFLPGREFAVALWGRSEPDHASVGEMLFAGGMRAITYAAKWESASPDFANTPVTYTVDLEAPLRARVLDAARSAWRAVGARGYLRVDIRLDAWERPKVIDVNPNCETAPGVGIHRAVVEAGWTWERFVRAQVEWA